jgi:hypothetical protein
VRVGPMPDGNLMGLGGSGACQLFNLGPVALYQLSGNPRTDAKGRALAHPVLVSDEYRQSVQLGRALADEPGEIGHQFGGTSENAEVRRSLSQGVSQPDRNPGSPRRVSEAIYNQELLHSSLGCCPPAEFERQQSLPWRR